MRPSAIGVAGTSVPPAAGSSAEEHPSSGTGAQLLRRLALLPFGMMLLFLGVWAIYARRQIAAKDWTLFHDTASLLLAGRVDEIYPGVTPKLPFFYPPFFLWHVLPLGLVPREWAHGAVVAAMALATAVALWALRAALDASRRRPVESWIWFVLSSAGWTWMIACGHLSAWYLMLLAVALLLWTRGRPIWAGVVLSLVLTKPHYALVILAFVALAGGWWVVVGAAIGAALLGASTYPLGSRVWTAWLAQIGAAASVVFERTTAWKQITVRAFWTACLGTADGRATAAWIATAAPAAALAAWAAWRSRERPDRLPRALGLGVLVALACGPYAFHYDGLLLAVPGIVWCLLPESYLAPWARAGTGAMILLTYVVQFLGAWVLQDRFSCPVTGLAITAWLVLEAVDLSRTTGAPSTGLGARVPCPM